MSASRIGEPLALLPESMATGGAFAVSLLLASVLALLVPLTTHVLLWTRRRRRLVAMSSSLPGSPVGSDHPHPWLADAGIFKSLPSVPGRPAIRMTLPWWEDACARSAEGGDGIYRVWVFNPRRVPFARCVVAVFDPRLAAEILGPGCYGMLDKGRVFNVARSLVGDSMLSLPDGAEWKAERRLAAPGFGHAVLERATYASARLLREELFPKWDDRAARDDGVDVIRHMLRFALDVLGEVAFSFSFGGVRAMSSSADRDDDDGSMYHVYDTITEILTLRSRSPPFRDLLPTEENRRFRRASARLDAVIGDIVAARMREQRRDESSGEGAAEAERRRSSGGTEKTERKRRDLLSQLLLKDENGTRLSHARILGNVRMFLFAGHDTTASTLSYAIWHLATHPAVQRRLRDEVDPLFDDGDPSSPVGPTFSELRNLRLLDAVLREALRLNAPAAIARRALRDVTVGGHGEGQRRYVLPEGCEVFVFPWLVHRNRRYWGDGADEFDPDRWLLPSLLSSSDGGACDGSDNGDGAKANERDPPKFMPFSVGPRNCIGQQLAMAEMRAVLAHVVRRYEFVPAEGAAAPVPNLTMTISPHEVRVRFRCRHRPQ